MKKVVCYASALGGCSNIQSYEHYVSQGIFSNKLLTVEGQSWLKGEKKEVNYKKLGLPILCEKHNKALSPIDKHAHNLRKNIVEAEQLSLERHNLKRSAIFPKKVFNINGNKLEQWAIKCALGVMFENKDLRWHPDHAKPENPPVYLLNALYGLEKLKSPMGLYLTMAKGHTFRNMEISGAAHLHHPDTNGYVGALVNLLNYKFMIFLVDEEFNFNFPGYESFPDEPNFIYGPDYNQPDYHPSKLEFAAKGKVTAVINLDWDASIEPLI